MVHGAAPSPYRSRAAMAGPKTCWPAYVLVASLTIILFPITGQARDLRPHWAQTSPRPTLWGWCVAGMKALVRQLESTDFEAVNIYGQRTCCNADDNADRVLEPDLCATKGLVRRQAGNGSAYCVTSAHRAGDAPTWSRLSVLAAGLEGRVAMSWNAPG